MKYKLIKSFITIGLFSNFTTFAQNVISTGGQQATGIGGSLSYTVGQVAYRSSTGLNGTMAEGIQQQYEISILTGFEFANHVKLNCSVSPNPTSDFLIIEIYNLRIESLTYQLIDENGRILINGKLVDSKTKIDMCHFSTAIYFLRIVKEHKHLPQEAITFKIIKN